MKNYKKASVLIKFFLFFIHVMKFFCTYGTLSTICVKFCGLDPAKAGLCRYSGIYHCHIHIYIWS